MMLCTLKHNNEYKASKNTQGGRAGGLLSYSSRLSVAICIGSHALIGTGVGLGRWAGCLKELVAQNVMRVVVCAIGQHKRGRY